MLATTPAAQRQIIAERVHVQRWRQKKRPQREVSLALGWGLNRVGQVERAEIDLTLLELYDLADGLGTTVDYLLGLTDDPRATSQSAWTADDHSDLAIDALLAVA